MVSFLNRFMQCYIMAPENSEDLILLDFNSEQGWYNFFHTIPDSSIITNYKTGKILRANYAAEEMFGFEIDEMMGKTTVELGIWPDSKERKAILKQIPESGRFISELPFKKSGKEWRYGLFSGQHIEFEGQHSLLILTHDITKRKIVEQALKMSQKRYHLLEEFTRDVPWKISLNGILMDVGPALRNWEYVPEEWIGKKLENFLHGDDVPSYKRMLENLISDKRDEEYLHLRIKKKNGEYVHVELSTALEKDTFENITAVHGIMHDITQHILKSEQLKIIANEDELTGLYNRRFFIEMLEELLSDRRKPGFYLLMLDLDDFKVVNDSYGHQEGDIVLKKLSQCLLGCVREEDTVCRLGGDEFAVIIKTDSEKLIRGICERIIKKSSQLKFGKRITASISVSLGAAKSKEKDSVVSFMQRADHAMYDAKKSGKNNYILV